MLMHAHVQRWGNVIDRPIKLERVVFSFKHSCSFHTCSDSQVLFWRSVSSIIHPPLQSNTFFSRLFPLWSRNQFLNTKSRIKQYYHGMICKLNSCNHTRIPSALSPCHVKHFQLHVWAGNMLQSNVLQQNVFVLLFIQRSLMSKNVQLTAEWL